MVQSDNEFIPQDPIARFQNFLLLYEEKEGEFKYLKQILKMASFCHGDNNYRSLVVDYSDLMLFDHSLAYDLHHSPGEYIKKANQALVNLLYPNDPKGEIKLTDEYFIHWSNVRTFHKRGIRQIRSWDYFKLVGIDGIVLKTTKVNPYLTVMSFECKLCGARHNIEQIDEIVTPPSICNVGGCKNSKQSAFRHIGKDSEFIDWQEIEIQEFQEELIGSDMPQALKVLLLHDNVGKFKPGDRVSIAGVLNLRAEGKKRVMHKILEANYIYSFDGVIEALELTEEDINNLESVVKKFDHVNKCVKSVEPGIYGHEDKKLACLLSAFGSYPIQFEGHVIRDRIHISMVGDPGTAKSQILSFMLKLLPRAIKTNGSGSTKAGLTVFAQQKENGKWELIAGAVVLANGGHLLIEEFKDIRSGDLKGLKDPMEEGTLSVSKAGINAILNAKTALITTSNPSQGRWNPEESIAKNLNLDPAIISRFDLILLFIDKPSLTGDSNICDHIISMVEGDSNEIVVPYDAETLRKLIKYARETCFPKLPKNVLVRLKEYYVSTRNDQNQGDRLSLTPRAFEALIRLTIAHARMSLKRECELKDAEAVINLHKRSMMALCYDENTESFDVDKIMCRDSRSDISVSRDLYNLLVNYSTNENRDEFSFETIHTLGGFGGDIQGREIEPMSKNQIDNALDILMRSKHIKSIGGKMYKVDLNRV